MYAARSSWIRVKEVCVNTFVRKCGGQEYLMEGYLRLFYSAKVGPTEVWWCAPSSGPGRFGWLWMLPVPVYCELVRETWPAPGAPLPIPLPIPERSLEPAVLAPEPIPLWTFFILELIMIKMSSAGAVLSYKIYLMYLNSWLNVSSNIRGFDYESPRTR